MKPPSFDPEAFPEPTEAIRLAAREWVGRQDRGLTPDEASQFRFWLESDPMHGVAWEECSTLLERLDPLTIDRAVRTGARRPSLWVRWAPAMAAAALVLFAVFVRPGGPSSGPAPSSVEPTPVPAAIRTETAPEGTRVEVGSPAPAGDGSANAAMRVPSGGEVRRLSDGTLVFLKPGAEFYERFTARYRAVNLVRGEAMFDVVSGSDERLFVMTAGEFGTDGAVAVSTRDSWFFASVGEVLVQTKVLTGQVMVEPAEVVTAPVRTGQIRQGMLTDAGLSAKIEYPSNIDSVTHVSPLAPSDLAELMTWKRSLEVPAALPVALQPK